VPGHDELIGICVSERPKTGTFMESSTRHDLCVRHIDRAALGGGTAKHYAAKQAGMEMQQLRIRSAGRKSDGLNRSGSCGVNIRRRMAGRYIARFTS
jgi:hypothetical protein